MRLLRSQRRQAAAAFGVYLLFAVIVIGRGVLLHPATRVIGDNGADKSITIWALKWWPWAVAHGHDPFAANVVWAPHGIDLAWVTAIPGASLLTVPITFLAGPVVSYNLLALLALPLAAWTAFLLARHLSGSFPASLVGGYLFGFSPFMLGHEIGHLNLILTFPVPLAGLVVLKRFEGSLGRAWFVGGLAAVLVAQFLFSTEIFLTMTLVGLLFLGLARWRLPAGDRGALFSTAREAVVAYVISGIVLSPYLVHAAFISQPPAPRHPELAATDALNYFVATRRIWLRLPGSEHIRQHFTSNGAEQGAYVALPLLAVVLLFALRKPRAPRRTILLLGGIVIAFCALGPFARVDGKKVGDGPWALLWHEPLARNALPIRFPMYVSLLVGLICALWLAERPRSWWRWALVSLGVVMMLPNPTGRIWAADVPRSSFFESGDFKRYLHPDDVVLVTPYGPAGWSMLWQAQSNFGYRMIGGHVGYHLIAPERQWRSVYRSFAGVALPGGPPELLSFLQAHAVHTVIVGPGTKAKIRRLVSAAITSPPDPVDDVLVYTVPNP